MSIYVQYEVSKPQVWLVVSQTELLSLWMDEYAYSCIHRAGWRWVNECTVCAVHGLHHTVVSTVDGMHWVPVTRPDPGFTLLLFMLPPTTFTPIFPSIFPYPHLIPTCALGAELACTFYDPAKPLGVDWIEHKAHDMHWLIYLICVCIFM